MAKMANFAKDKMKILNAKFLMGNASFTTPFKTQKIVFYSPVQSTGRAIVVTLASALALPLPLPFPSRHF